MGSDFFYGKTASAVYETASLFALHNNYYKQFLRQADLDIKDNTKVLDLGCGGGRLAVNLLNEYVHKRNVRPVVHAVDISEDMLKLSEKKAERDDVLQYLRLYKGDAEDLSTAREFRKGSSVEFRDGQFDIVMAAGLLECVPQPARVLEEMLRVLKPSGQFVISCVNKNVFGEIGSRMWKYNIIPKKLILSHLGELKDLKRFKVRTMHPYMGRLKSTYTGVKV
ncbi:methyltransferase domain-containing protein [Candidatus Woesearchaeota archaeon]|nr:methyltransferase domain-containing protein [Candidatus Woesearchaeota archaeon]